MARTRVLLAIAAVTALALTAAGCGSDSDGNTGSASDSNAGDKATGTPLKVMQILDENEAIGVRFDDTRSGAKAGLWAVNNRLGGFGTAGHEVEHEVCVTNQDANQVAACARKAAADPSVVAVIGSYGNSPGVYPILEKAGIAMIANQYNSVQDGLSPVSFPTSNGNPAPPAPAAPGQDFARDIVKAKKVAIAVVDVVGATSAADFFKTRIEANGMEVVASVPVSAANPDLSAPVATLVRSGADSIQGILDSATTLRVVAEVGKQGASGDLTMMTNGATILSPDVLKQLGPAADSLRIDRRYAPIEYTDAPGVDQFKKDLKSSGEPVTADDQTTMAYVGFLLLDTIADKITGTVDRASILKTAGTIKDWNADGLTSMLDFTKPGPDKNFPRYVAPVGPTFPARVVDGKIVSAAS